MKAVNIDDLGDVLAELISAFNQLDEAGATSASIGVEREVRVPGNESAMLTVDVVRIQADEQWYVSLKAKTLKKGEVEAKNEPRYTMSAGAFDPQDIKVTGERL